MRLIRLTEPYIQEIIAGRLGVRGPQLASCALTLGSFDGLHGGHRALLRRTREARDRLNLAESVVFTFRQHPRELLDSACEPFLLTTWREKLSLLEDGGCRVIVAADFCPALADEASGGGARCPPGGRPHGNGHHPGRAGPRVGPGAGL